MLSAAGFVSETNVVFLILSGNLTGGIGMTKKRNFHAEQAQHPQKLICGLVFFGNAITGKLFVEKNLTGDLYLTMSSTIKC